MGGIRGNVLRWGVCIRAVGTSTPLNGPSSYRGGIGVRHCVD